MSTPKASASARTHFRARYGETSPKRDVCNLRHATAGNSGEGGSWRLAVRRRQIVERRRFDVNDGVRNLREGRLRAMRRPINPITFEAESVSEGTRRR